MDEKKAVALRYEKQVDAAPRVVAKGAGEAAQAIIRLAASSGVEIYENQELAKALMGLQIDSVIPPELYAVVAKVLSYVYQNRRHAP